MYSLECSWVGVPQPYDDSLPHIREVTLDLGGQQPVQLPGGRGGGGGPVVARVTARRRHIAGKYIIII